MRQAVSSHPPHKEKLRPRPPRQLLTQLLPANGQFVAWAPSLGPFDSQARQTSRSPGFQGSCPIREPQGQGCLMHLGGSARGATAMQWPLSFKVWPGPVPITKLPCQGRRKEKDQQQGISSSHINSPEQVSPARFSDAASFLLSLLSSRWQKGCSTSRYNRIKQQHPQN